MSRTLLQAGLVTAVVLGAATGACAQDRSASDGLFAIVRRAPTEAAPLPHPDRQAPVRQAGVAQTAVDQPLAGSRLVGSVGFLCGLQPTPDVRGGASAFGADDQGRFLGAKLHFAFR